MDVAMEGRVELLAEAHPSVLLEGAVVLAATAGLQVLLLPVNLRVACHKRRGVVVQRARAIS